MLQKSYKLRNQLIFLCAFAFTSADKNDIIALRKQLFLKGIHSYADNSYSDNFITTCIGLYLSDSI